MPSPFPGMDPYLEAHWGDVHQRLIIYSADHIQRHLPADLRARVEERVFVETPEGGGRSVYPDVRVVERPHATPVVAAATGTLAVAEPLLVELPSEQVTESYLEIREIGSGNRVVTVIEFVSAANKRIGPGRKLYLQKQQELRAGDVNSVEIDLLRGGDYVLSIPKGSMPPEYRTPYRICVWREKRPTAWEVYRVPLRERLPTIRIPLRPTDVDVPLDLQSLVEQCYTNGGYDDLDYRADSDPPLSPDDARWADELLRSQGLRA